MPAVVSRWHLVLSKNFLPVRYDMLSAEHGGFDTFNVTTILPWLVSNGICWVPLCGTVVTGGGPVFTSCLSTGFWASPLRAGFVVQVHFAGAWVAAAAAVLAGVPPVVDTTMPTTTPITASTPMPPRMPLRRRRRRAAFSWRAGPARAGLARGPARAPA